MSEAGGRFAFVTGAAERAGRAWDAALRVPVVGWVWRFIGAMGRNNVTGLASQLAYSALFALFPFLICMVALASFLPVHGLVASLLAEIEPFLPAAGFQVIQQAVDKLVEGKHAGLLSIGFAVALWSASSAINGLLTGLNQIYGVYDRRSIFVTRGLSLGLTVAMGIVGLIACLLIVGGGSVGQWVSQRVGHPELYSNTWSVLRWPAAAGALLGVILVMYRVLPDVELRWRDVLWGSLFAAGAWVLATLGFSVYLSHFPNFGAAYGSLGTAVVLLTWFWLNGVVLLLGGQINALVRGMDSHTRSLPKT